MISVIVPVYQAEKYLDQCIQSLCRQSHRDLEILLIDDGSTDRSPAICRQYAEVDNRIHAITGPHQGVSHTINLGIRAAQGEHLVFVDADDWVEPDYVAFLFSRMQMYAVDLVVTSFVREMGNKTKKIPLSYLPNGYYDMRQENNPIFPALVCGAKGDRRSIEVSRSGKIFKSALLKQNLGWFREDIHYGEDWLLVLAYALDCRAVFLHADSYLYHYRLTPGSATTSYQQDRYFRLQALYAHLEDLCRQKSNYDFTSQFQLQKYRAIRAYIQIDVVHYWPHLSPALVKAVQEKCSYYNAHQGLYPPTVVASKKQTHTPIINYFIRRNQGAVVCTLEALKLYTAPTLRFLRGLVKRTAAPTPCLKPAAPVVCDWEVCTGCGACAAACPVQAIKLQRNTQGFLYPVKETEGCTDCGLCAAACPARDAVAGGKPLQVFGCKHTDPALRSSSSSGGLFPALAQGILARGGVVYGVVLDNDGTARHCAAKSLDDLSPMQGSKYLQSDLAGVFEEIKVHLKERPVLFTGTPCQVAGLKGYLPKDDENLYTADLICLGAASPLLFQKYLQHISKRGAVSDFRFRYKIADRTRSVVSYMQNGTRQIQSLGQNPYTWLVLTLRHGLRYCCHNCKYKTGRRIGDISLGDFWGLERIAPDFADHGGVSLALVNTANGQRLFEEVRPAFSCIETDLQSAAQSSLAGLSIPVDRYAAFMADLAARSFLVLKIKYVWTSKVKQHLTHLAKKMQR